MTSVRPAASPSGPSARMTHGSPPGRHGELLARPNELRRERQVRVLEIVQRRVVDQPSSGAEELEQGFRAAPAPRVEDVTVGNGIPTLHEGGVGVLHRQDRVVDRLGETRAQPGPQRPVERDVGIPGHHPHAPARQRRRQRSAQQRPGHARPCVRIEQEVDLHVAAMFVDHQTLHVRQADHLAAAPGGPPVPALEFPARMELATA